MEEWNESYINTKYLYVEGSTVVANQSNEKGKKNEPIDERSIERIRNDVLASPNKKLLLEIWRMFVHCSIENQRFPNEAVLWRTRTKNDALEKFLGTVPPVEWKTTVYTGRNLPAKHWGGKESKADTATRYLSHTSVDLTKTGSEGQRREDDSIAWNRLSWFFRLTTRGAPTERVIMDTVVVHHVYHLHLLQLLLVCVASSSSSTDASSVANVAACACLWRIKLFFFASMDIENISFHDDISWTSISGFSGSQFSYVDKDATTMKTYLQQPIDF